MYLTQISLEGRELLIVVISPDRDDLFYCGFLRIFPNSPSTGSISIRPLSSGLMCLGLLFHHLGCGGGHGR